MGQNRKQIKIDVEFLVSGDHLYGKLLFYWLLLVMFVVMSCFMLSFFLRDVLDEIWN